MSNEEKFIKFKELKGNCFDFDMMYIFNCMVANNGLASLDKDHKQTIKIAQFIQNVWLKSEEDISIGKITDIVMENWQEVQREDMSAREFISEYCFDLL